MKLYVMRHGPAEEAAASGVDADRALTSSGRERVQSVAKVLVEQGEAPLRILTSPLVRAVQTAEIVAVVTKLSERAGGVEARREVGPSGNLSRLVQSLSAEGARRVMFVGHEPQLSDFVEGAVGTFSRSFDKAMVVGLHLSAGDLRPTLRFVLDPKSLRLEMAAP